ncbi:hypothetical protein MGYG_01078 [Nannizzia gypsea CBS 118893]|uniref:Uncharacterized protein n=1 Tax=Arthroderma gypseum (strain ATCC MYA-4604 / CBS 118893) TaxID=535722 RepID=E5QYG4_ARTGP|nr:hypothetical protein MGYG_01078 [Nannizzia gypsea CBS 118893]EFQ98040.1 hypothetical protein MGYG_01078 [Nannizzia gypsea CBS 118893]
MSDVETASSLPETLNSSHQRATLHLAPKPALDVPRRATSTNGDDGRPTAEDADVNDDAVSVKADSEAETIIQSGREELSPEKKKTYIRHVPGQNAKNGLDLAARKTPKFSQPGNWQLGKRKRPDHENDDSRSTHRSNQSSRASSPVPALKQEKSDEPQVLSNIQGPPSPRDDGPTERKLDDKPQHHRKPESTIIDTRDVPSGGRRPSHRSQSHSNEPVGKPDLYAPRRQDRSPSPPIRSHKRVTSDSTHSPPLSSIQKRRKLPPQPLMDQTNHPSEGRASPFSASSAGSPPPNPRNRRLTSCDTYPFSPVKQTQNKKLRDQNGRTRLARACAAQEIEAAKCRQAERPEDLNVPDNAGNTPLQIAALEGCAEIVKFLIEAGCDIHTKNIDRDTPLIDAVENGHLDVVKILLEAGANPRVGNAKGDEPYDLVPSDNENRHELRRVLAEAKCRGNRRRKSDDISGHGTASTKDPRSRGASAASSPDSPPHHPQSPPPQFNRRKTVRSEATRNDLLWTKPTFENLRLFAAKGDMAGVATILNILQKADTESLIAAAKGGHDEVLGLLLGMGNPDPDPEPLNNGNHRAGHDTPMLAAIGRGNIDVIKLLLDQPGFNPTRTDHKHRRFFELAEDRRGDNWELERDLLKEAYDEYVSAHPKAQRVESRSPRRSRDALKVAKRPDRDSASPASVVRKSSSKGITSHRQSEEGPKESKPQKERKRADGAVPMKERLPVNKGSSREDSHGLMDDRDTGHSDRKQKMPSDSRSPREPTPHKQGEEPVKRRRLIAGRPPPDHAKRRPSVMSSDSFSGREDAPKAGVTEDSNDNGHRSEKRSSILKRARNSVSPKPPKPRNNENEETREKHAKKRRILSSEISSQPQSTVHRDNINLKAENPKAADHSVHHNDKHRSASRDPAATKLKHRASDSGIKAEAPSESNAGIKTKHERHTEKEHVPTEAELERAAEKAQVKARKEAEAAKIAAEKAAIIEREKAEQEERKLEEERKQQEEERKQQEERKRKEIEQQRARQAEEEHQRRVEQERLRQARIRREQEEQEQRRRDALPHRLRTAANLVGANDPKARSHEFLKNVMPILQATRDDLEPLCEPELRNEKWILNFYVALLLATNDLQLSQYPSWEKKTATPTQRSNIWDCSGPMLSNPQQLNPVKAGVNDYSRIYQEAKPLYEKMEHVFWVKCSDFMDLVPHIPHLHGLNITFVSMHIDPEPSSSLQGKPHIINGDHASHHPIVNGTSEPNGIHSS